MRIPLGVFARRVEHEVVRFARSACCTFRPGLCVRYEVRTTGQTSFSIEHEDTPSSRQHTRYRMVIFGEVRHENENALYHAAVLHVREARCNTAGWEAEVLVLYVCRALVLSCSNVALTFLFGA